MTEIDTKQRKRAACNTGFASGGALANLELCASTQAHCLLTDYRSMTRPNAKPETVSPNARKPSNPLNQE
jgi:hypothetical protein